MTKLQHIMRRKGSLLMIPFAVCVISGCRHKDLADDIGQTMPLVTVEYEWAETELFRPDGLANLFYSTSPGSESYWRSDFRPAGGSLRLPADNYDVVAFNNDTENIIFSDIENINGFSFSTSEIDISGIPEDQLPFPPQKLYRQPDRMWVALQNDVTVEKSVKSQIVNLKPRRITRDYHVEMTGIEHLESALRYYAAISDLSPEYNVSSLRQTGNAVTVGSFMLPVDDSSISATITNFGNTPESAHQRLAVYMWLADGSRKVYRYDVTDQIRQAPDPMNLLIRVKGPSWPEITPGEGGGGGSGGLDVGVDDWDFIDIEL